MTPCHLATIVAGFFLALHCVATQPGSASGSASGKPVEQSSTVITFYNGEYAPMYFSISQCELLVRRAAKHGSRRIQFVPTHYWYDKDNLKFAENTCYPDNWSLQNKVDYYCYKHEWNSDCRPWDDKALTTFRTGFTSCLKVAVELFDEFLIAPHLDDGLKRFKWRNFLHNDPLWEDPYGYSFYKIMHEPILDAANAAMKPGKTFWFGMEGEMGGTVLSNPAQYLKVYDMIRKGWKNPAALKVGSTFNHAYIMGYINHGPAPTPHPSPESPMAAYNGGWGPILPFKQWPNYAEAEKNLPDIKALLEASDFLGVSNYARADDGNSITSKHIESGAAKMIGEFAAMGIDIKALIQTRTFMYNEFGMGGGLSECGNMPGSDAKVGYFPWLGVTTTFTHETNPFQRSAVKEFAIQYYKVLMEVLDKGGSDIPVHQSYIWNCVSWDVQGIHTASALWHTEVDQGDWPVKNGFAIKEVIDMIKDHNKKVLSGRGSQSRAVKPSRREGPTLDVAAFGDLGRMDVEEDSP